MRIWNIAVPHFISIASFIKKACLIAKSIDMLLWMKHTHNFKFMRFFFFWKRMSLFCQKLSPSGELSPSGD